MSEDKNVLLFNNLEIKINSSSEIPHVILDAIDFKENNIGLKSLKIVWGSIEDEVPETLIKIEYILLDSDGKFREMSLEQSFPNSLLVK